MTAAWSDQPLFAISEGGRRLGLRHHSCSKIAPSYAGARGYPSSARVRSSVPDVAPNAIPWPHVPILFRLGLALGIGLFVGLERERRGKEAGVRTFAFAALLGCMGGLLGDAYALLGMGLLGVLVALLCWQTIRANGAIELTTSAALLVTGFAGVAAGQGHTFTPVAVGVLTAALLTWKEHLAGFSVGLREVELRSAVLLAILTFVVYPVLPTEPVDPWGMVEPRAAWVTVILIAALGFGNYILLKLYGARGVAVAGFLGGLVNSTVTVTELAGRVRDTGGRLTGMAYRGVLLSTTAMVVRNVALLAMLAPAALASAVLPLGLMLVAALLLAWLAPIDGHDKTGAPAIELESPFSLRAALKFGLIFLTLEVVGTLAQVMLGQAGFYAVSLVGGVVSSASAVASAASLAEHARITPATASTGAVLASIASAMINLPLVARVGGHPALTRRLLGAMSAIAVVGLLGISTVWLTDVSPMLEHAMLVVTSR
ncbi:MAG: MgtC/SapB family protein [Chloroflexi bacterium]|nr:MgtC/SapB family protein [Chloroflexota bacterium]